MSCVYGIETNCDECRMCQSKEEQNTEIHNNDTSNKKAILIIDIPESCEECPMINGADECILQNEDINFFADTWNDLMAECPLKKMPEKKPAKAVEWLDFNCGWNACIDEILED